MKSIFTPNSVSVTMLALMMTGGSVSLAQESTDDPFLDAMLEEQRQLNEETVTTKKMPTADPAVANLSIEEQVRAHDPRAMQDSAAMAELQGDTGLYSAEQYYEGKYISAVEVRYAGGASIPTGRIKDQIATKAGQRYRAAFANDDLERLVKEGLISPNSCIILSPAGDKVKVVFEVGASSFMGGVGFTGNKYLSAKELRELTELKPGLIMNDKALAAARAAIIKEYQSAYYPDVKVTWREVKTARNNYRDIIFDIVEGEEVDMVAINFEGNKQFDDQQLRQIMSTKELDFLYFLTKSGRVDREKLREDLDKLINHYRNFGYLRARVANVEYGNSGKPGHQKLHMKITIEEGERYMVRSVKFKGNTIYTQAELEPGLSMLGGDIYSLKKVTDDITMIRRYYGVKGYADANAQLDVAEAGTDAKGNRLIDITYELQEGNRFLVGSLNVRGNTKTRQHVILRELPLQAGSNLNSVDVETARKRLQNLGYFQGVEVSQVSSDVPGYRDININVAERQTGSVTFGVAFSTIQNAYIYTSITQSNFDVGGLFDGNFIGEGQRLTLSGNLGTEYQSASLYLLEPWFLDKKLAFGNELFYNYSQYISDYYTQVNYGYAVSLRRALSDAAAVKVQYRLESFSIDADYDAPTYFLSADGDYTRSNIELSYEYDTRDASITPRKGGNLVAAVNYSGPGSTVETAGASLIGSYYVNSAWDSIFSINFGLATVDTIEQDEDVPIFERCFLGGQSNMRGFRYHDVGIVDEDLTGDETMGGKTSAYAQFEVTVPIVDSVRFATFLDVGFVHAKTMDFGLTDFASDFGFGLRMDLGMGPMAIDFAFPLQTNNAIDDGMQVQFYIDYKY